MKIPFIIRLFFLFFPKKYYRWLLDILESYTESGFGEYGKPDWLANILVLLYISTHIVDVEVNTTPNELIQVTPMDGPVGMVFYMNYENDKD